MRYHPLGYATMLRAVDVGEPVVSVFPGVPSVSDQTAVYDGLPPETVNRKDAKLRVPSDFTHADNV